MSNPFSIALARLLAKGHADAALAQFNDLQRVAYDRKQQGLGPDFQQYVERAVPAAASLALALELALKVLYFQHRGQYPKTHNLEHIVDGLSAESQQIMRETYELIYAREHPLEVVHFALSFAESGQDSPSASAPDLSAFRAGLSHASAAYVKWRYLYEHMESPDATHVHFKALLSLVEAAHAAISAYKGTFTVKFGG